MAEEKKSQYYSDDGGEDIVVEEEGNSPDLGLKKLREKLKECRKEKEEYLTGWQRARADFINARKEDEKSREEFKKFAKEELLKDFFAVTDGFEAAFAGKDWQTLDKTWQDGLKSLYAQSVNIFKKHKIEPIEAKGKEFNPAEHEVIGEVEVGDKKEDGIAMEEVRRGYRIGEKILRPAQIKVGKYKK